MSPKIVLASHHKTGSVFLSNTEDSGIEFHGGSAYIRSVGYNGFERARDS